MDRTVIKPKSAHQGFQIVGYACIDLDSEYSRHACAGTVDNRFLFRERFDVMVNIFGREDITEEAMRRIDDYLKQKSDRAYEFTRLPERIEQNTLR